MTKPVNSVTASKVSATVRGLAPSGICRFFDLIATMDDVISLGVGEPDFVTPEPIREAGIRSLRDGETHYTSNYGMLNLRVALHDHLVERYHIAYEPEHELLITVGVSEGLDLAMRALIEPGDEVIIPDPGYVSYYPNVVLAGGKPVPVATTLDHEFQLTAEAIAPLITPRTKAILLASPCNPTGSVTGLDEQLKVAALAEQHDLVVIHDQIYDRLVYDDPHVCFASLPGMWERTIVLGGWSKAYAMTGWRVGYAAAPRPMLDAMVKIHQFTMLCAPITAQVAALEALGSGESFVRMMVAEYGHRRRQMVDGLNALGLHCQTPRGAFYAFPSIADLGLGVEEFSEKLLFEERVAVVPGTAFGPAGDGFLRCAYCVSPERIDEALARMGRFLERRRR